MSVSDRYQVIVIGSGQAGTPLCAALADAGLRTALVERAHVGGTCVNEGCTPTKTMVASARVAYLARRGADYGVRTGDVRVDMARVRQRKRDIVDTFRHGSEGRLEKTPNLDLVAGQASFAGPTSVQVRLPDGGERVLHAERIVVNAGTRPAVPRIDGLSDVAFLDSTSVMELETAPEHLIVLGGGYVGLEFAQMFRRFGSRVTIVQRAGQLLGREDPDIAREVAAVLAQDGIDVRLNATAERVARTGDRVHVTIRAGHDSQAIDGSHLLVATGRTPNTGALNLSAAGVAVDGHGFIRVNDRLETTAKGIFAVGDINGGPAFTHISYDDFRILRTNLLGRGTATTKGRLVPYVVFIDPQLGRVGLTESDARAARTAIRVARMPMAKVARALEVDEPRGLMKVVVDAETDLILGAAVLGLDGGEVMSMLQLAMMGRLPFTALREGIFAHPTLAESLNNLFTHFDS